jgi:hypothetical protein
MGLLGFYVAKIYNVEITAIEIKLKNVYET